jgi:hypothetical protein
MSFRIRRDRAKLDPRKGCEIEPGARTDPAERALAETIRRRLDAAARGETRTVSMLEADGILRERQKARRSAAR